MRRAFECVGYHVILICGDFKNRRNIVDNVIHTKKIDFTYCESVNAPFAISGKHRFPLRLFSDIHNIKRLRLLGKVGFFYRDINWKEKSFYKKNGYIKGLILYVLFYIEYTMLIRNVDVLFVPSIEMATLFPKYNLWKEKMVPLPPACRKPFFDYYEKHHRNQLRVLYSGNTDMNSMYNLEKLLEIVKRINRVFLTVNSEMVDKCYYEIVESFEIQDRVKFISYNFEEAEKIDDKFDVGIVWQDGAMEDIKKYMPIKLFYYLQIGLPIIGRKDTAYGNYIEKNNIGWTFSDIIELADLFNALFENRESVDICQRNVLKIREENTWKSRAEQVSVTLDSMR
jgi:hypothetical protein